MSGLEPILVVFERQREKEGVWAKIRENVKGSQILVTQFDSKKIVIPKQKTKIRTGVSPKRKGEENRNFDTFLFFFQVLEEGVL